jgi:prolyl 3-hydroxylase /prolyl 3,4-dihydroxylase
MARLEDWILSRFLRENFSLDMAKRFRTARPFSHICLERFLIPRRFAMVRRSLVRQHFYEKRSDLFQFSQTVDLSEVDDLVLRAFYEFLASPEFAMWVSRICGVRLRSGALDVFGAKYQKTDYLLCHDDRLARRKVAYIFYFGDSFGVRDGGELELFSSRAGQPSSVGLSYLPRPNSLILFLVSPVSFHAVREVLSSRKVRYSIGGWLR